MYEISKDPFWYRWLDGLIVLVIGFSIGVVASQVILSEEVTTVTSTTRIINRDPDTNDEGVSALQYDASTGAKIEEN